MTEQENVRKNGKGEDTNQSLKSGENPSLSKAVPFNKKLPFTNEEWEVLHKIYRKYGSILDDMITSNSCNENGDKIDIPSEGNREDIQITSVLTYVIIHFQMHGIFLNGIYPLIFTAFLQIGAILIFASIPYNEAPAECEINRFGISRNWALIIGLYIYVVACIGEFISQNLFNIRLLSLNGVYRMIRDDIKWFDFTKHTKSRLLCRIFVALDHVIWISALIVGARLIIISDKMQDVILNSLSAVFVVQLDNIVHQMIMPVVGDEDARSEIFVSKDVKIYSYGKKLPNLLIHPVIPTAIVLVLFAMPYW